MLCPVCDFEADSWEGLARHMSDLAGRSDHVMWLNRNVSQKEMSVKDLSKALSSLFSQDGTLADWVRSEVIRKIYASPHQFIAAMQNPTREVLLGYVLEHQHFLKNWVHVLSSVIYRTDREDVIKYELENISTEYLGCSGTAHYELLLQMGEALGMSRAEILATPPLRGTVKAIEQWNRIASEMSWAETMAAMHSLEFIADRSISSHGARVHYFNVDILESSRYPEQVKKFLGEGYSADTYHANEAISLVEKYMESRQRVQVAVMRSLDAVSTYLNARLERAEMLK